MPFHHLTRTALVAAWLVTAGQAQAVVVPPFFVDRDATGPLDPFPGTYLDARQQVLIGARELAALQPGVTRIESIAFRRDGSRRRALAPGRAHLVVRVSSQARSPSAVAGAFADNHGALVETVFDGRIALPASPPLTQRDQPDWTPAYSFTIPFQAPITYRGGALCIEVEGRAELATDWPIDYHVDPVPGSVARVGTACGPILRVTGATASASAWYLRPGSTASFDVVEEDGAYGILMLATQRLSQPLSLAGFGAPGCDVHVVPAVTVPTLVRRRAGRGPMHPGIGRVPLPIPNLAHLSGGQMVVQWLNLHGSRLTVSDALVLGLGGVSTTDAAIVSSTRVDGLAFPAVGRVRTGALPVVALHVE